MKTLLTLYLFVVATASFAGDISSEGHNLPPLPEPISSFGAAVSGDWLYVYGGHVGRAHQHSYENLAAGFRRLNLTEGKKWKELAFRQPVQGTALVASGGMLYRVGGLSANNPKEEAEDLWSVDSFERYDPETNEWTALTPLPHPRSSHGAAAHGGKIYVVGGWTLRGASGEPEWREEALVANLSDDPIVWEELPAPGFTRRALAVAANAEAIYAIGGMDNGTSKRVDRFDLDEQTWERIEDFPTADDSMKAFGAAAVAVGNKVYASAWDAQIRLWEDGTWKETGLKLNDNRFFHELVSQSENSLIAMGGASMQGHLNDLEWVNLRDDTVQSSRRQMLAREQRNVEEPYRWVAFRNAAYGQTESSFLSVMEPNPTQTANRAGAAPLLRTEWEVDVPGYGQSTPTVWGSRVFVTSVVGEFKEQLVVSAYDRVTGEVVWRRMLPATQGDLNDDMVSRAAPSAVADHRRLYVFFESGDLMALDHDGNSLWKRSLTREKGFVRGNHGLGSSLALAEAGLVVAFLHEGPSALMMLNKRTGETEWEVARRSKPAWSTPIVMSEGDREYVILSAAGSVDAYDAASGESVWTVNGIEKNNVPTPIVADGLIVAASSSPGQTVAIKPGGSGDVTKTHVVWRMENVSSGFGSPIQKGECLFSVNRAGAAFCVDVKSGESRWETRLSAGTWASPIAVSSGALFFTTKGSVEWLKGSADAEDAVQVGSINVGDSRLYGAALAGDQLLLRTGNKLVSLRQESEGYEDVAEAELGTQRVGGE